MPEPTSPRPSVWARLRNARVPQLMGVYAGGSFAVLQGTDIFVERLGLPNWTFFGIVVLLLAGIPIVVATALVQQARRAEEGRNAEADLLRRASAQSSGEASPERAVPEPSAAPVVPSRSAARLRRIFTWRNTGFAGAGALAVLALVIATFMAMRALGIGPVGSLVAAGVLEREEPVLIADFQSLAGDDLLAGAVTEAFRIDFEQSPLVRVVGPGQVREALLRMRVPSDAPLTPELARELALREGIKALLLGEINPAGQGSILSVRLVSAETEETLVSFREAMPDSASIIPAVDRISNRLRERIGESLRSIRGSEPLDRVSTSSLPALRLYSQAVRAVDRDRDFAAGIALLEEAIAQDSTFAMAWRKLGVTLSNAAYPRDRWEEAFTRAYEYRDRLTDRERYLTQAIYHTHVLDDPDRAIVAYRTVLDAHPHETTALNNLAGILSGRGDHEGAAELYRRAMAIDSTTVIYYTNLLNQLVAMGEWEEAEHILERYGAWFPGSPSVRLQEGNFAAARGDYDRAERLFHEVVENPRAGFADRLAAEGLLASLALVHGRLAVAERHVLENRAIRRRMGQQVGDQEEAAYPLRIQLMIVGDTVGAVRGAEELLGREGIPPDGWRGGAHVEAAHFFVAAGRPERAREFLREWDRLADDERVRARFELDRTFLELGIAAAEGRHENLLAHLRRRQREEGCAWCLEPQLADAYLQAGVPDSAIVHYERYLQGSWLHRLENDAVWLPRAHETLGRLYAERGETEAARRHLTRFIELWEDADPPLHPRVQEARRRLAELTGG